MKGLRFLYLEKDTYSAVLPVPVEFSDGTVTSILITRCPDSYTVDLMTANGSIPLVRTYSARAAKKAANFWYECAFEQEEKSGE